jgi:hypothetical protein
VFSSTLFVALFHTCHFLKITPQSVIYLLNISPFTASQHFLPAASPPTYPSQAISLAALNDAEE